MNKPMIKPAIMGALMGVMMLWMLHGVVTDDTTMGTGAVMIFVGAHVLLVAIALCAALFATRMSPPTRAWVARLRRPSLRHVSVMLGSGVILISVVHVGAHGLGGV